MSRLEGSRWRLRRTLRYGIEFGIPGVKPFVIQNQGKYERQAWQEAEFPSMDRTICKNRENVNQHTGDSSSIFTMRNR